MKISTIGLLGASLVTFALTQAPSKALAEAQWFDATDGEVLDTGWNLGDLNTEGWAQAARAANGFCGARGFVSGRMNGHQLNNLQGVVCVGQGAQWFDATDGQLLDTGWNLGDLNTENWAQAARAANNFCFARGFVSGFMNGHQLSNLQGVVCVGQGAQWFDATDGQLLDTGWSVGDLNTELWAQAARAANGFCFARGFVGGFMNGHQVNNLQGVVCLSR